MSASGMAVEHQTASTESSALRFAAERSAAATLGLGALPELAGQFGQSGDDVNPAPPNNLVNELIAMPVPEEGRDGSEVLEQLRQEILAYGPRTGHPRFYGFIPGPALTESWLAETVASAANLHAATWKTAPTAVAAESSVLCALAGYAGYPASFGGGFVSGGSVANLTALVAARDALVPPDQLVRAVAYVSSETHSSVAKALRVIGISDERIRKIDTDHEFRLRPESLRHAIAEDRRAGLHPFTVVATAGSTNTGTVDPIEAIADICEHEGLWLHVDGAYGASTLISDAYRDKLAGIARSDSLSWDAHKLLFQTYGLGIVLVRHRRHLERSFSASPDYLEDVRSEEDRFNPCDLGIELTRSPRGLRLWFTLQVLGRRGMEERMEWAFGLAEHAERRIRDLAGWEISSPASLGILTFRFTPSGITPEEADELNATVAALNLDIGHSTVYTTTVHGRKVLRMATTNPETRLTDIDSTIELLDKIARERLGQPSTHFSVNARGNR